MKKVKDFITKLICDHPARTPNNMTVFTDGHEVTVYGMRCMKCGKVWKVWKV